MAVLKVKKTDADATYDSISVTTSYVSKSNIDYATLWKNAQFCSDLDNGLILLSDDVREYQGSDAWDVIEDFLDARDASGRKISRPSATVDGWHYQTLDIEVTVGKYQGFYNKDSSENDIGFVTHKIYDGSNNEIISSGSEANAVRTEVLIRPTHDFEILGAIFGQHDIPSFDLRLWVIGLPGVANIKFSNGGKNLKHAGNQPFRITDGRASKYLKYVSVVPDANSFKLIFRHPTSSQHTFQISLEIFKAA